jgi:hypothetical protein
MFGVQQQSGILISDFAIVAPPFFTHKLIYIGLMGLQVKTLPEEIYHGVDKWLVGGLLMDETFRPVGKSITIVFLLVL